MELHELILITLITLGASYIQSVTGFGFGIFAMIFLPSLLIYTESNFISSVLSSITSLALVFVLRKKISWKNIIFPIIGSFFATYAAVYFIKSQKNETLTLFLGIALFILSVYFFFFSDKIKIKPTPLSGLIAGTVSGIMSGMFSIGGPPVVIYFMQSEDDSDSYLATISAYFVFSGMISIVTKAAAGFVTKNALEGLIVGLLGMFIGSFIGKLTREKTKPKMIKKAVYAVMAVSGIVNIVTSVI